MIVSQKKQNALRSELTSSFKKRVFPKMWEFAVLTASTLPIDDREVLRGKINDWVKNFLPKLKRESTSTDKCRILASLDRQKFINKDTGKNWRFCEFEAKSKCSVFDKDNIKIDEFNTTVVCGQNSVSVPNYDRIQMRL